LEVGRAAGRRSYDKPDLVLLPIGGDFVMDRDDQGAAAVSPAVGAPNAHRGASAIARQA